MNRAQIKQLSKKIDKLIGLKRLPTPEEIGIPLVLKKKYGLNYTNTLGGVTDRDLDRMIEGESQE